MEVTYVETSSLNAVVGYVRRLAVSAEVRAESDQVLLERFLAWRDAAFAALVQRHGPLVWGICRRVLGNHHDADDCFQGTFLVLADRAASMRKRTSLRSWLYGVAYRVARRARAAANRRQKLERCLPAPAESFPPPDAAHQEVRAALAEEVSRLPETAAPAGPAVLFRGPDQRRGGTPIGLSTGDSRHPPGAGQGPTPRPAGTAGLTLSAGAVAVALSQGAASGAVPAALAAAAVKAALGFREGGATVATLGGASALQVDERTLTNHANHEVAGGAPPPRKLQEHHHAQSGHFGYVTLTAAVSESSRDEGQRAWPSSWSRSQ